MSTLEQAFIRAYQGGAARRSAAAADHAATVAAVPTEAANRASAGVQAGLPGGWPWSLWAVSSVRQPIRAWVPSPAMTRALVAVAMPERWPK